MLDHKTILAKNHNLARLSKTHGFTLIELLVVLLIIGITLSFGLMAFGDFGEKRRIINVAEQFINDMHALQQQAIIENSTLGIKIEQHQYSIWRFNFMQNIWEKDNSAKSSQHTVFPKQVIVNLQHRNPDIIINSLGEINTNNIEFGSQNKPHIVLIKQIKNNLGLIYE